MRKRFLFPITIGLVLWAAITGLALVPSKAEGAVPQLIAYQGRLGTGTGVPLDTTISMTFTIYDASSSGTVVWSEVQNAVVVRGGIFNVLLGSTTTIGDSVFSSESRWLGITVGADPEISPRSRLVSVGYAHRVNTIDGAIGGKITGGLNINPGVPGVALQIVNGPGDNYETNLIEAGSGNRRIRFGARGDVGGQGQFIVETSIDGGANFYEKFRIQQNGAMLIGNRGSNSSNAQLALWSSPVGSAISTDDIGIDVRTPGGADGQTKNPIVLQVGGLPAGSWANAQIPILLANSNTVKAWSVAALGNEDALTIRYQSGSLPSNSLLNTECFRVTPDGHAITKVLEITGGSDLAEPFPVSDEKELLPGAVVVIDENNPGHLKLSSEPYDKRVAGVVSGAGGIKPGLTLKQEGVAEGTHNVALTGRVYVLATASNGPIKPGDLLTTSSIPGHAMIATDRDLSNGAIIGKAMSSLEKGEGLILVLVNLQ